MAYVGRLAGAVIAETEGQTYLIGDCKEPCVFEEFGFATPRERNVLAEPYILLKPLRPWEWRETYLQIELEGEALPQRMVDSLLILRNGSVSERLWRLIISYSKEHPRGGYDATWLATVPHGIWDIVRDQVLRCV